MTNKLTTKFVSAAIAASCTFISLADVTQAQTVEFAYANSELQTPKGREAVKQRIKVLARDVCRDTPNRGGHQLKRACRKDVTNQILQQMGKPGLRD